ncbi:membrane protein, partial [Actinotalea fermentans ATCC 43279 = JCM 9966 = DSM 3133]
AASRQPATAPAPGADTPSRAWAATALLAGLTGIVSIQASMALSVNWTEVAGDPDAIVADLAERVPTLLVFHTATALCTVLLLVAAAGFGRRLRAGTPAGSLLPAVASGGLLLTSAAALLGGGLDTQFMFALGTPELVNTSGSFYSDWVATIPWLWLGAGVSALAVAVAGLRHRAVPRWIAVVSLLLGGLTVLTGVSPFQYLAGMVAPVWLVVVALGFLLGDRRR